eukprot:scaffold7594_cov258-Pinguiococcus_pyrenoidosus.AAC.1
MIEWRLHVPDHSRRRVRDAAPVSHFAAIQRQKSPEERFWGLRIVTDGMWVLLPSDGGLFPALSRAPLPLSPGEKQASKSLKKQVARGEQDAQATSDAEVKAGRSRQEQAKQAMQQKGFALAASLAITAMTLAHRSCSLTHRSCSQGSAIV